MATGVELERFLTKIRIVKSGCWLWVGAIGSHGYGNFRTAKGDTPKAHRYLYKLAYGDIPAGLELDHLCRVRACVRPSHLEPVTKLENQHRSPISRATINSAKTACPYGHPYTYANTIVNRKPTGRTFRNCRVCRNEYLRRWRKRRRMTQIAG